MNTDKDGSEVKSKKPKGKIKQLSFSASLRLCGFFILLTVFCLLPTVAGQPRDYTRWVNPFIGTGGHGHTFPGATMPFGMVQLSPDTRTDNWDGSSGYHYSDDVIYGFSHTHLSGTGIPDGCDILFMPTVGAVKTNSSSKFSHATEIAKPGYYSVSLENGGILAEMTTTQRVGLHRYTFPESNEVNFILDLKWRDRVLDSQLAVVGDYRMEGYRRSSSWAKDQKIYFVAEFSKPFEISLVRSSTDSEDGNGAIEAAKGAGKDVKAVFRFSTKKGEKILLKVALSPVSIEGARANLKAELPGWDFEKVRADAKAAWNKELSKIEVSGGTDAQTTTFYTALYHTMIQPNIFNDVDGKYLGMDKKVYQLPGYSAVPLAERRSSASPTVAVSAGGYAAGFEERRHSRESNRGPGRKSTAFPLGEGDLSEGNLGEGQSPNPKSKVQKPKTEHYTVFSLWDTFRAAHPLYTIIDQRRTADFINTFIRQYEQGGRLPVWELWGEETDTMIGYHAVSVIADAMAKGIKGFDYEKAYAAAKHSAELDHFGLAAYKKRGYISMEDENESVSRTLEYAYNDWCIARMAEIMLRRQGVIPSLGHTPSSNAYQNDFAVYSKRARYFENLFDPKTGFFRPKKNGGFVEPFAPNEVTFGFTEGNSWQYSFFVPHNMERLMQLMGGDEKFVAKLDELFTTSQKLAGREQADLTGLIGQYAHGNEPSHHIAYLYNYAGQMWKTQKYVRKIMDEFYKNAPDGLIGNEDCGQMSAWFVLSASGFYPVAPGEPKYTLGTPLFPEVRFHLENGRTFTVRAPGVSARRPYVKSVRVNGKPPRWHPFLLHQEILDGATVDFDMTDAPAEAISSEPPRSDFIPDPSAVPWIDGGGKTFRDKTTVTISSIMRDAKIYFTTDGSTPTVKSKQYSQPFVINAHTTIKAITLNGEGVVSPIAEAEFFKRPNDWTVKIASKYSRQYTGGGDDGLIDGIRGTVNFASGEWQGYQGQDFVATIDLQKETTIREVGGGFLQVAGPWIWMPDRIEFETSTDGGSFTKAAEIMPRFPQREMTPTFKEYRQKITPTNARFVRIRAFNFGKIPSWHPGAGGDPWIFVDEVIIR